MLLGLRIAKKGKRMRFRNWSKHLVLGLLLVFALSMAACGKSGDTEGKGQEAGNQETEDKNAKDKEEKENAANGPEATEGAEGTKAPEGAEGSQTAEGTEGGQAAEETNSSQTENKETGGDEVKKELVTIADKAYESFSSFIDAYYFRSRITEGVGSFIGDNLFFWEPAEMYEMVIDAYEHTGDQRYYDLIHEIFEGFKLEHGEDWTWNEYNDDIAWMTIACARAYKATGKQEFLDMAVKHFDIVWERGWSDDLGGGVWWRTDNNTKNACINCPLAIAACFLGDILKEEGYYEKAVQIMDWVAANIYDAGTGNVYDAYSIDGNKNHWASTYNQGTFIGANTLLYIHYGEKEYYTRARKAADYTIDNMYHGGVMNNEDNSTDLVGFKGILSRWMYHFAMYCGQKDVMDWLRLNAESAWSNRNSDGLMTTAFGTKTPDGAKIIPYSASAAVAVLNNCREEGEIKISVSDTIDIDMFARCGRLVISGEKGSARTIETVGSNAYLEYDSVRFDAGCSSLQFSMAADQECTIEVRLDAVDGELVATLPVPAGDAPKAVQADIGTISGRHNVYLVIPEKGRRISY